MWTQFDIYSMCAGIFSAFLFMPIIKETRVQALGDILGLFYIAQAGIVGAYMGVTAWMSRK